jgi:predicted transcriptional regulator YheO
MARRSATRRSQDVAELRTLLTPLMRGIASAVGQHCEVVLHDLSAGDFESTIVAIENGHVTGRSVGGPSTNLGLELMQEQDGAGDELGYRARTRDGRELHCSSVYYRDDEDRVIAALCINVDMTPFLAARGALDEVVNAGRSTSPEREEIFASDINDLLDQMIEDAITGTGKSVSMMDRAARVDVLRALDGRGAFAVKRAVDRVSRRLGISRVTTYNYLEQIRNGGG